MKFNKYTIDMIEPIMWNYYLNIKFNREKENFIWRVYRKLIK